MDSSLGTSKSDSNDFLSEFRSISSKLKKRFLRRPNVAEANELYAKLAKRLQSEELPQYEALCHEAVAKCEQAVGNPVAEADALLSAARCFWEAESKTQTVGCPSQEEYLLAAISSYNAVIRLLVETNQMDRAAGVCIEIGDNLLSVDRPGEALAHYKRAADLRSNSVLDFIFAKEKLAYCHIENGDYFNALVAYTEVATVAEEHGGKPLGTVHAEIIGRCEVYRLLLLLIIEPITQNISPSLTSVLEKYFWEAEDPPPELKQIMSEDLLLLLQSLVMAVQISDYEAVMELEDHLGPKLSQQQRKLLRTMIKNFSTKATTQL